MLKVLTRAAAVLMALSITAPMAIAADTGIASHYGGKFHGRKTASGERYNQNAMTAAHRRYAFGTKVRVTNIRNGKSVIVRINDRGPFVRGRVVDVSMAAARQLGFSGLTKVTVEKAI